MSSRTPPGPPPPPVVCRLRVRYAKRGPLRFSSHRDVARAVERAVRRAGLPVASSAGFSPHPKISWVGAAPTGVASEAEYVEIGLTTDTDPSTAAAALDAALPPGLDVLEMVRAAAGTGGLAERVTASIWQVVLDGVTPEAAADAATRFLAEEAVIVPRRTKDGSRELDARAAVVTLAVRATGAAASRGPGHAPAGAPAAVGSPDTPGAAAPAAGSPAGPGACAILDLVVRHATPTVRPDDVLAGLRAVSSLEPPVPPRATRLAQGTLRADGEVSDPLAPDRDAR